MTQEPTERATFPGFSEAESAMPEGRKAYASALRALIAYTTGDLQKYNFYLPAAIRHLNAANQAGTLEPPLSDELGALVERADQFVDNPAPLARAGFEPTVAHTILAAVIEHGYQYSPTV